MLFGVPIALLAAIYTSEFLSTRARAKVKPAIELMASLPSVVLGFLAALVFAPIIEQILPSVLAAFVMVPLTFLIGAYLWQLLPYGLALRLGRWRLPLIACFLPLGFLAAYVVGPPVERWIFGGDLTQWLDGGGNPAGGWLLLLLPLFAAGAAVFVGAVVNPWLRGKTHDASRAQVAFLALLKFLFATGAAVGLAWLASLLFAQIGWDARGGFIGQYDQRNSLVIGFVMGFAIIPIIFTIADDALSTVPRHLRSGSLGAGATQWQTSVRIVIPTAMSGLFSAVMIGLGRAVGETMIVLMATGSTPITEWNVFNGFRTLSATIATELPEAARGGTHFRTLFLAALTLFLLTFIVNTIAEVVRLRFRKRAYQL
jgi:phosphate transport system permease protein